MRCLRRDCPVAPSAGLRNAVDWRRFAIGIAVIAAIFIALAVWLGWWFLVIGALFVLQLSIGARQVHKRRR